MLDWKLPSGNTTISLKLLGAYMFDKLLSWVIFSVLLALIPIIFSAFPKKLRGYSVEFAQLIENGELLIVSAALCAGAVGELINSISKYSSYNIVVTGSTILLLFISAMAYAAIDSARYDIYRSQLDSVLISRVSLLIFCLSVISSGACIAIGRA